MGFKLKKRTVTVQLDGDFEGMEIVGAKSLPWKTMQQIANFAEEQEEGKSGGKALARMKVWLMDWLGGWNLVDDGGKAVPLTEEAIDELPSDLVTAMFARMNEALTGSSELPLEPDSASEPTSVAA